ncbi:unnamed protein product [Moneuplotes crassus]|uniref:Uncharacterized protein n=1 Tax=Euplotes crassus TaxID=5936 RepID=A0AAD1XYH1_EUPCR|nr:unnamed protein product [Moneuplotes crassus]
MWLLCINKRRRLCYCIKPSFGVKYLIIYGSLATIMQIFWMIYRVLFATDRGSQDSYSRAVECDKSYLGFGFDVICNFFGGYINPFTFGFNIITIICGGVSASCGIYVWLCDFPFHWTERYFYIHFIVSIYYQLHAIIIHVILSDRWLVITILGLSGAHANLSLNVMLGLFLLDVEQKYRRKRETNARYYLLNEEE